MISSLAASSWIPTLWSVVPFAVLLGLIAVLPLVSFTKHAWEKNWVKLCVILTLGLPVAIYVAQHDRNLIVHAGIEFVQFILLLAALFIVASGIHIKGDLRATPGRNAMMLASGYIMASVVGTMGASILMIYPLLRSNQERKHVRHTVVFFIFLVSNLGGLLTPLGDPPLFLGYLRGIEFFWFARNLWVYWLVSGIVLLAVYLVIDKYFYNKESNEDIAQDKEHVEPLMLIGLGNAVLMMVIVGSVIAVASPWREVIFVITIVISLVYSKLAPIAKEARQKNNFEFGPIVEVAVVFAGIFMTMVPALQLLQHSGSSLGVSEPAQYFWATGVFSSVLDNAPTFLVFMSMAESTTGSTSLPHLTAQSPDLVKAISLGAVYMGALTYIGNAPNFMIFAIAKRRGISMPSFFGYIIWSVSILGVLFIIITFMLKFF
ncbi:MAG: sodium:proton antiporter [Patescibacteria group bacterium]